MRAFLRHELDRSAGRATELAAAAGRQLDVVDHGSGRDLGRAAGELPTWISAVSPEHHLHADRQALRREDVALLAVAVVQQRDVRRAVRVVLDRGDLRRHAVLAALEVDARGNWRLAPPPRWRLVMRPCVLRPPLLDLPLTSDFSGSERVSSSRSSQVAKRRAGLVGLCLRIAMRYSAAEAAAPSNSSMRSPGASSTIAFFHCARAARGPSAPLGLGLHLHRAHVGHAHVEDLLDRRPDRASCARRGEPGRCTCCRRSARSSSRRSPGCGARGGRPSRRPPARCDALLGLGRDDREVVDRRLGDARACARRSCRRRRRRAPRGPPHGRCCETTSRTSTSSLAQQHSTLRGALEGVERLGGRARRRLRVGGRVDHRDAAAPRVHAQRRAQAPCGALGG